MKNRILFAIAVIFLIIFTRLCPGEPPQPTTQRAFDIRRQNTGRIIIGQAMEHHRQQLSNVRKIARDILSALRDATPESIQTPIVVASGYYPMMDKGAGVLFSWIEDHPSLSEVDVRNPETNEVFIAKIPVERLEEAKIDGEQENVFIYSWYFQLPVGFAKGSSQALEISTPHQVHPATCYPLVPLDIETAPTTTQPVTQPNR